MPTATSRAHGIPPRPPARTAVVRSAPSARQADAFDLPFAIVCIYAFILVGRPQDYLPVLVPLRLALVFTGLSLAATVLKRRDKIDLFAVRESKLYLWFYAALVIGIPLSIFRRLSFEFVIQTYIVNVIFFIVFQYQVTTVARLKRMGFTVMLAIAAFSVVWLYEGQFDQGRFVVGGEMFDPNDVAFVEISLLPFVLMVLLGAFSMLAKTVAVLALGTGTLLALYTGSRGGLIGLATLFLLFMMVGVPGVGKFRKIVVVCLLVVAAGLNVNRINVERYLTLTEIADDYNTTDETGRVQIWRRGLQAFLSRPLTGVGALNFGEAIGTQRAQENLPAKWQAAHNSYLEILAETGVLGFGAYMLLIATCLRTFSRVRKRRQGEARGDIHVAATVLLVGFWAQLVVSIFLTQGYSIFFTLYFAMAAALSRIAATADANRDPRVAA